MTIGMENDKRWEKRGWCLVW